MKKTLFIFILTVAILGCSSEETNEEIPIIAKVTDSDQILSIENFKQVGFKKSKKYKVDELPGATSAYYGFIKNKLDPDDQKIDYEIFKQQYYFLNTSRQSRLLGRWIKLTNNLHQKEYFNYIDVTLERLKESVFKLKNKKILNLYKKIL